MHDFFPIHLQAFFSQVAYQTLFNKSLFFLCNMSYEMLIWVALTTLPNAMELGQVLFLKMMFPLYKPLNLHITWGNL